MLRSESALVTKRELNYTWTLLMSAMLGMIFGLMQFIGVAMNFTESVWEKILRREGSGRSLMRVKSGIKDIQSNFAKTVAQGKELNTKNAFEATEMQEGYFRIP